MPQVAVVRPLDEVDLRNKLGLHPNTILHFSRCEAVAPSAELRWVTPRFGGIHKILDNLAYAGVYAYGRTEHGHRYVNGTAKKSARRRERSEWLTFIPNHHDG